MRDVKELCDTFGVTKIQLAELLVELRQDPDLAGMSALEVLNSAADIFDQYINAVFDAREGLTGLPQA